ncbi:MAG TPA: hypothetical protein DIS96_05920, partial [Pusillimonas sp.]|nr:hypothetical protein [Pusillimonas sp.]
ASLQWIVNNRSVAPGTNIDVSSGFSAKLALGKSSDFLKQWLVFQNNSSESPLSMTATIGDLYTDYSTAVLTGKPTHSYVSIIGQGTQDSHHSTGGVGPNLDIQVEGVSVEASLDDGKFDAAGNNGPTSVYHFRSEGAQGSHSNGVGRGFDAGTVSYGSYGGASITGSGTLAEGSSSLPWEAGGALVTVMSKGGQATNDGTVALSGGFGGDVSVHSADDLTLNVNAHANSPMVGLLALSQGGKGTINNYTSGAGSNGKGGIVDVTFQGTVKGSKPYSIGLVAASVGAATQSDISDLHASPSGGGSNVTLKLVAAHVNLGSTNTIGLVATSTAQNPSSGKGFRISGNSYRDVLVSLDAGSSVSVGNTTDTATATDTTIGILASSAVGWSSQPFLGTAPSSLSSPGKVGNVTIENKGSITALGSGAIGVVAQSIAGNGASASGGFLPFIGDSGGSGGTAGTVTYKGDGGQIIAKGAGATGLLMQSIAGGGGNGGNAKGLFVAVGGHGGHGGEAGTVSFSQKNGASITTEGNYAQGVVLQSVGGGGGNGGHASSYSIGTPTSTSIGGRGGIGGDGGALEFGG